MKMSKGMKSDCADIKKPVENPKARMTLGESHGLPAFKKRDRILGVGKVRKGL